MAKPRGPVTKTDSSGSTSNRHAVEGDDPEEETGDSDVNEENPLIQRKEQT